MGKPKYISDDEFLKRIKASGGTLKIEASGPNGKGLAIPYRLGQVQTLCAKGKIRAAKITVSPMSFNKNAVDVNPDLIYGSKWEQSSTSLQSRRLMTYIEVSLVEIVPEADIVPVLTLCVWKKSLSLYKRSGTIVLRNFDKFSYNKKEWVNLCKSHSHGLHYFPNYFVVSSKFNEVDGVYTDV